MVRRAWPEGNRWTAVRITLDWILPAVGILDVTIFSQLLPLSVVSGLFIGLLWMFLLAETWLTRLGVSNPDPWKSKLLLIGFTPVLSMMTALFLPFDTLPLLLLMIVGGVVLAWVLLKISRVSEAIKASTGARSTDVPVT